MLHNPITEEIREIRHRLAAQFGNEVYRIGDEIRRRQRESGRQYRRLLPRPPANSKTANQSARRSGADVSSEESTPAAR